MVRADDAEDYCVEHPQYCDCTNKECYWIVMGPVTAIACLMGLAIVWVIYKTGLFEFIYEQLYPVNSLVGKISQFYAYKRKLSVMEFQEDLKECMECIKTARDNNIARIKACATDRVELVKYIKKKNVEDTNNFITTELLPEVLRTKDEKVIEMQITMNDLYDSIKKQSESMLRKSESNTSPKSSALDSLTFNL